jgi:hypothetical protein
MVKSTAYMMVSTVVLFQIDMFFTINTPALKTNIIVEPSLDEDIKV